MKARFKIILFAFIVIVSLMSVSSCTCRPKIEEQVVESSKIEAEVEIETPEEVEIEEAEEIEEIDISELVKPKRTPFIEPVEKVEKVEENYPEFVNLGEFRLTAYCPCKKCCGKWSGGATASGVMPTANHTIAVDTNVIPFGTEIIIDGITYVAEDTGGAIKGNRIDIYFDSHQEALIFGVQYAEVFKIVY